MKIFSVYFRKHVLTIASMSAPLSASRLGIAPAKATEFAASFSVDIVSGDFLVGKTFSGQLVYV